MSGGKKLHIPNLINPSRGALFYYKINVMVKSTVPKLFVPRKIKGGHLLGKDGEIWFAVRAKDFTPGDNRDFKQYFAACCKEFFVEDEPEAQESV